MRSRPPSFSHGVLIDTSAYFAFIDRNDVNHSSSQTVFAHLAERRIKLVITDLILAETHALILNRLNRQLASRFLYDTLQGRITIRFITQADLDLATKIVDRYDDKSFSLTDATSFAIMERRGIRCALSFDRHFSQFGVTVLTTDQL